MAENPAADSDVALFRELGLHHEGIEEPVPIAGENIADNVSTVAI
jgi:hypothetical protein